MNGKAIVLLSGGLDSYTVLAIAKADGFDIYTMSFDYGQRQGIEIDSAKKISVLFSVKEHKIIKIDLRTFGDSALTDTLNVPKKQKIQDISKKIPITYVPARNTIFLAYALAWAEVLNAYHIFIGVNQIDYSGYPDCRPEFIQKFSELANLATKNATENKQNITIHTPLMNSNKAQIIIRGIKLGLDYSITHSCYDPIDSLACGQCDSCILRHKGFIDANIDDPTRYSTQPDLKLHS